jgi:hypothetical protein
MAALPSASGPLERVYDPFGILSRVAGAVGGPGVSDRLLARLARD